MTFHLIKLLLAHKSFETSTYKILNLFRPYFYLTSLHTTVLRVYIQNKQTLQMPKKYAILYCTQRVFQYPLSIVQMHQKMFRKQANSNLTVPVPVRVLHTAKPIPYPLTQSTFRAKSVNSSDADKSSSNVKYIIPKIALQTKRNHFSLKLKIPFYSKMFNAHTHSMRRVAIHTYSFVRLERSALCMKTKCCSWKAFKSNNKLEFKFVYLLPLPYCQSLWNTRRKHKEQ